MCNQSIVSTSANRSSAYATHHGGARPCLPAHLQPQPGDHWSSSSRLQLLLPDGFWVALMAALAQIQWFQLIKVLAQKLRSEFVEVTTFINFLRSFLDALG